MARKSHASIIQAPVAAVPFRPPTDGSLYREQLDGLRFQSVEPFEMVGASGEILTLGEIIGRGSFGDVYALIGCEALCVKIVSDNEFGTSDEARGCALARRCPSAVMGRIVFRREHTCVAAMVRYRVTAEQLFRMVVGHERRRQFARDVTVRVAECVRDMLYTSSVFVTDLKACNVLINSTTDVCIADYGSMTLANSALSTSGDENTGTFDSPEHAAHFALYRLGLTSVDQKPHTEADLVWALGAFALHMYSVQIEGILDFYSAFEVDGDGVKGRVRRICERAVEFGNIEETVGHELREYALAYATDVLESRRGSTERSAIMYAFRGYKKSTVDDFLRIINTEA